jgi:hypothetical protein
MALYRSYLPQADIPRPYHLLPSAAAEAKKAQSSDDQPSGETTESKIPLAEKATKGKAKRTTPPDHPWVRRSLAINPSGSSGGAQA